MLISEGYRRLNEDLHKRAAFGQRGARHAHAVLGLLAECEGVTVLDYGCGTGALAVALAGVQVWSYDPAIKAFETLPPTCDVVVCADVLEHIEPDCLEEVLGHIEALTRKVAYFVIATKPDGHKRLADGRDPHLIVQPAEWWRERLGELFRVELVNVGARDCTFLAWPRNRS